VSRYRGEIERDFRIVYHLDWRELWKTRQFRVLLNLIDGLPLASHYGAAMATDEDYIRAVIAANGGEMPQSSSNPSIAVWTPVVAALATIADLLKANNALLVAINSKPGAARPKVEPEPRPTTAWTSISMEIRLGKHRSLATRLLGDRAS
jgi:phosphomannomutase